MPTEAPTTVYDPLVIESCARAAHEVNRAYCAALGDLSQPSWADTSDDVKAVTLQGVAGALNGHTPEQSHEGWMALKIAQGWTYGRVKDVDAKVHPALLPYGQLPPEQRMKDTIYLAVVRATFDAVTRAAGAALPQG